MASIIWSAVLSKLDPLWQAFTEKIKTTATTGSNGLDESFFEMLKTTPSAASVYRQWMIGDKFSNKKNLKIFGSGSVNASEMLPTF